MDLGPLWIGNTDNSLTSLRGIASTTLSEPRSSSARSRRLKHCRGFNHSSPANPFRSMLQSPGCNRRRHASCSLTSSTPPNSARRRVRPSWKHYLIFSPPQTEAFPRTSLDTSPLMSRRLHQPEDAAAARKFSCTGEAKLLYPTTQLEASPNR
jgi:hypothetical protein